MSYNTIDLRAYPQNWVKDLYDFIDEVKLSSASKLIFQVSFIVKYIETYDQLADDIFKINLKALPLVVLLSLVRNFSSFRQKIWSYEKLLNDVVDIMRSRGVQENFILSLMVGIEL